MTELHNTSHPACVGFIMDGNRRWATEQGLPTLEGHQQGFAVFESCITWVQEQGISHAVFYAFSTENWRRSDEEVSYLMDLFRSVLERLQTTANTKQVRVRIIGRTDDFAPDIQSSIQTLQDETSTNEGLTIWIALSYGGRAELIAAVNTAVSNGMPVDEESFAALLWTADMPDPDLIIRTGGEERLSNFLPWQSVYSELMFIPTYWPAFTKAEFVRMLEVYGQRQRRKGA